MLKLVNIMNKNKTQSHITAIQFRIIYALRPTPKLSPKTHQNQTLLSWQIASSYITKIGLRWATNEREKWHFWMTLSHSIFLSVYLVWAHNIRWLTSIQVYWCPNRNQIVLSLSSVQGIHNRAYLDLPLYIYAKRYRCH